MSLKDFLAHCTANRAPNPEWRPALQALWHAEKGEWEMAHDKCQEGDVKEGAWVHANLHREEGDLANAGYWYHRAGKPESRQTIVEERHEIITVLLGDDPSA
ncbi:hypothetical protein P0Y35_12755 [Kiritimatiellaeota bacterium B1221]|nr:hypothetical protein [Kiritimatiellaeota bacterium B1221]